MRPLTSSCQWRRSAGAAPARAVTVRSIASRSPRSSFRIAGSWSPIRRSGASSSSVRTGRLRIDPSVQPWSGGALGLLRGRPGLAGDPVALGDLAGSQGLAGGCAGGRGRVGVESSDVGLVGQPLELGDHRRRRVAFPGDLRARPPGRSDRSGRSPGANPGRRPRRPRGRGPGCCPGGSRSRPPPWPSGPPVGRRRRRPAHSVRRVRRRRAAPRGSDPQRPARPHGADRRARSAHRRCAAPRRTDRGPACSLRTGHPASARRDGGAGRPAGSSRLVDRRVPLGSDRDRDRRSSRRLGPNGRSRSIVVGDQDRRVGRTAARGHGDGRRLPGGTRPDRVAGGRRGTASVETVTRISRGAGGRARMTIDRAAPLATPRTRPSARKANSLAVTCHPSLVGAPVRAGRTTRIRG